jgi:hypothetical protein
MTRPAAPRPTRCRPTCCVRKNVPVTLALITGSHCSRVVSNAIASQIDPRIVDQHVDSPEGSKGCRDGGFDARL